MQSTAHATAVQAHFRRTHRQIKPRSLGADFVDPKIENLFVASRRKKKAKKPESMWECEEGTSQEFDPDDPIGVATEEKDDGDPVDAYDNGNAERKLLAAVLKTGKLDPQLASLDIAYFDDEDLGNLWFTMTRVGEPVTIKKIVKSDRHGIFGWDEESLSELKREVDPDVDLAELVEEIRRGFACREAVVVARNLKIQAQKGDEKAIAESCRSLLEDAEGVHLDDDDGMSSAELVMANFSFDYLIDDVLVAGQPMVIGARSKSLKTTLAIDMAVSLGTGTKFLDKFATQQARVAMFSGESGGPTIRETALRVAKHKQVELAEATCRWYFRLPLLSDAQHLARLRAKILKHHLQIVFIDPLYMALHTAKTAGQAGNVFMAGALLGEVTRIGQETNCTIVLLHHFAKTRASNPSDPATLEELSQAGMAEWARQWILLERREPYADDGRHAMWMRTGGSAGHAGLWALDVNEGTMPNRIWQPTLMKAHEFKQEAAEAKEHQQAVEKHQKQMDLASQVELYLAACPKGATATDIRNHVGVSSKVLAPVLADMLAGHKIVQTKVKKGNNRPYDGYTLTMNAMPDYGEPDDYVESADDVESGVEGKE